MSMTGAPPTSQPLSGPAWRKMCEGAVGQTVIDAEPRSRLTPAGAGREATSRAAVPKNQREQEIRFMTFSLSESAGHPARRGSGHGGAHRATPRRAEWSEKGQETVKEGSRRLPQAVRSSTVASGAVFCTEAIHRVTPVALL